jgi:hypothetical protein
MKHISDTVARQAKAIQRQAHIYDVKRHQQTHRTAGQPLKDL